MSVKKTKKTNPAKKQTARKKDNQTDQQIKEDIRKAVEKIPGLIVENIDFNPLKNYLNSETGKAQIEDSYQNLKQNPDLDINKYNDVISQNDYQSKDYQTKKIMLISAVIILSLSIFSMWAWSALVTVQDINQAKIKQPGIWDNAKQSFNAIMNDGQTDFTKQINTLSEQQKTTEAEAATKKGLTSVINMLATSSTSSTTK